VTLGGKPYRGYPAFSAPDEFAVALKDAGFDIFLNANNHILDRGSKGLHRTLDVLDSLGLRHTGVFRDGAERKRVYPLMIRQKGVNLAFLNYTYGTNGLKPTGADVVNYIDTTQIRQDILAARLLNADFIIANMHWGLEYKLQANDEQKRLAKWLIDQGVDIVMGNHPHVIQPSETLTDSLGNIRRVVVYSLGNFVSNMTAPNTNIGEMVQIVLKKDCFRHEILSFTIKKLITKREKAAGRIDFSVIYL
jgi:poly-gamma-glutamate synthesis protein (capsule biosynthesis protein)